MGAASSKLSSYKHRSHEDIADSPVLGRSMSMPVSSSSLKPTSAKTLSSRSSHSALNKKDCPEKGRNRANNTLGKLLSLSWKTCHSSSSPSRHTKESAGKWPWQKVHTAKMKPIQEEGTEEGCKFVSALQDTSRKHADKESMSDLGELRQSGSDSTGKESNVRNLCIRTSPREIPSMEKGLRWLLCPSAVPSPVKTSTEIESAEFNGGGPDILGSDNASKGELAMECRNWSSNSESSMSSSEETFPGSDRSWDLESLSVDIYEEGEAYLEKFNWRCPPGGEKRVVLYFTSLQAVRQTHEDCRSIRLLLKGLGVFVDERDVWMDRKFRTELTEIMGKPTPIPRLFIKGRDIGGAQEVKQLHEEGILVELLDGVHMDLYTDACDGCGDIRFIPCLTCYGSRKLFTEYGNILQCHDCNENGIIACPFCS